jgi:integrase
MRNDRLSPAVDWTVSINKIEQIALAIKTTEAGSEADTNPRANAKHVDREHGEGCLSSRAKRERIPDVLELAELQLLLSKLAVRERTLALLDAATGLRVSELLALERCRF